MRSLATVFEGNFADPKPTPVPPIAKETAPGAAVVAETAPEPVTERQAIDEAKPAMSEMPAFSHNRHAAPPPVPDIPVVLTGLRKMRVLAAEDNKTNRLVFSKMIKSLDIDLQFAENGVEAVEGFQSFKPDIIFMDISMPKMDGKQATQEIRKLEEVTGGHIPVIAMTAHAMNGDKDGIIAAGLDHYLTKPLRKAAIIEKVEQYWTDATAPLIAPED